MKRFYINLFLLCSTAFLFSAFGLKPEMVRQFFGDLIPIFSDKPESYCPNVPNYLNGKIKWNSVEAWNENDCGSDFKARLGRVIFYDKSLSKDGMMACASCHKQANSFADNVQFSEGIDGRSTSFNTPGISDLGWKNKTDTTSLHYFWNSREGKLSEMVMKPFQNPAEMGIQQSALVWKIYTKDYYKTLFTETYGDELVTTERIGDCLAHFIESMVVSDTKYDSVKAGIALFTQVEAAGEILFNKHCNTCHAAPNFGLTLPLQNGFPFDPAGNNSTNSSGVTLSGKFKSPSLRNIALTAPYMHNGKYKTLKHVLRFYSDSLVFVSQNNVYYGPNGQTFSAKPMNLSGDEQVQIEAFLNTLTGHSLLTDARFSDPFVDIENPIPNGKKLLVKSYPNPVKNALHLELDNAEGTKISFELQDVAGRLVRKSSFIGPSFDIETEGLAAGIYFLNLKQNDLKTTQRIVIQ